MCARYVPTCVCILPALAHGHTHVLPAVGFRVRRVKDDPLRRVGSIPRRLAWLGPKLTGVKFTAKEGFRHATSQLGCLNGGGSRKVTTKGAEACNGIKDTQNKTNVWQMTDRKRQKEKLQSKEHPWKRFNSCEELNCW